MNAVPSGLSGKLLVNSLVSRLRASFLSGQFGGGPKHDHYADFGWPTEVTFSDLQTIYTRNGLAQAAVEGHIAKVWETDPELFESEEAHDPTELEETFKRWAEDLRLWQKVSEADRRSMVGDYAGLILQVADNLNWEHPLGKVRGLEDIWDLIPAWEGELTPATWDTDTKSRRYGQPITYQYTEQPIRGRAGAPSPRNLVIHHSRVIIWSTTGDLLGRSILRAGYNALLDVEKVIGGGAEGFWKNARQSLSLDVDANANLAKLAQALGVGVEELGSKLNDIVDDWAKGFDKALITQGIKPQALNITMPQPEEFQDGPMKLFAASVRMPVRVMIGNVTGERATVEDEHAWAKRCNGLREKEKRPLIKTLLNRLEACGALPTVDWYIDWADLTSGTLSERLDVAAKMAEINSKALGTGDYVPFTSDEIREAAGYDVEEEGDGPDENDGQEGEEGEAEPGTEPGAEPDGETDPTAPSNPAPAA